MDECIDSLGTASGISILDASSGYWQAKLTRNNMDKTAPVTHNELFGYTRMPFGLKNVPATFQRAMDNTLAPV